jgi:hypothetical protein
MDDILIYIRTLEEHVHHLKQVFKVQQDNKLFIKFSRCAFAQPQVEYLGHIISDRGVACNQSKIEAMVKWLVATSFTEIKSFLGLTGYYKKFVRNYRVLTKLLRNMLKQKVFSWTAKAEEAFQALKMTMCSVPVLDLLDFREPFEIEIDACEKGVGVVLSQRGHLVAFFSEALSATNQKLSTYEKELLAVLMAVDKWRAYLMIQPFTIKTGHKSLCHLQDQSISTYMQRKAMAK